MTSKNNIKAVRIASEKKAMPYKNNISIEKNKTSSNQLFAKNYEKARNNILGKGNKRVNTNLNKTNK